MRAKDVKPSAFYGVTLAMKNSSQPVSIGMRHSETLFAKNNDLDVAISDFKVLSVLGSGSFGTVFLV